MFPRNDLGHPLGVSLSSEALGKMTAGPVDGILEAIGSTPLVALNRYLSRGDISVWAKLEAANPAGSAKDRPASRMIADAIAAGRISASTTVIESTSGNLGLGLAQACRFHGVKLVCIVDSRAHETNVRAMRALGTDVRIVTKPDPETGDLLSARLKLVARLLESTPDSHWPDQYANESNPAAHLEGTMREIDEALEGDLDYLLVATSTTGTLRGCAEYLREHQRPTRIVAVDALGSALFGGRRAPRLLPGFGAGVATSLSKHAHFHRLVRVSDLDCVIGARRLASREAILAGASAGGVMVALERIAGELERDARCAVILADGGFGYLASIYDDEWVEAELGCAPQRLAELVGDRATPTLS